MSGLVFAVNATHVDINANLDVNVVTTLGLSYWPIFLIVVMLISLSVAGLAADNSSTSTEEAQDVENNGVGVLVLVIWVVTLLLACLVMIALSLSASVEYAKLYLNFLLVSIITAFLVVLASSMFTSVTWTSSPDNELEPLCEVTTRTIPPYNWGWLFVVLAITVTGCVIGTQQTVLNYAPVVPIAIQFVRVVCDLSLQEATVTLSVPLLFDLHISVGTIAFCPEWMLTEVRSSRDQSWPAVSLELRVVEIPGALVPFCLRFALYTFGQHHKLYILRGLNQMYLITAALAGAMGQGLALLQLQQGGYPWQSEIPILLMPVTLLACVTIAAAAEWDVAHKSRECQIELEMSELD